MAALADDIAYHSHDLDDGLRAGLFGIDDISHLPVVGPALARRAPTSPDMPPPRLRHETIRRVINVMVDRPVAETRRAHGAPSTPQIRCDPQGQAPWSAFSPGWRRPTRASRSSCFARMYRHWRVNRMTAKARRLTAELFALFIAEPGLLPDDWRARAGDRRPSARRHRRRLHRRHDRPLRARGIPAADGPVGRGLTGYGVASGWNNCWPAT